MNSSTVLFLVNDALRAVRVSYEDGGKSKETIKKTFIQDLKPGEYVLVETGTRWLATVCKVVEFDVEVDLDSDAEVGWVFARADVAELERLKTEEAAALSIIREAEKRKRKAALRATILDQCGDQLKALPSYRVSGARE